MRFIPTKVHGIMDYLVGIILIAAPFIFGFNYGGAETWIPIILGAGAILYSLFTDGCVTMVVWLCRHGVSSTPYHRYIGNRYSFNDCITT